MKNNIVIMNFSGVYEVQGLKAVLEAGKQIIILIPVGLPGHSGD